MGELMATPEAQCDGVDRATIVETLSFRQGLGLGDATLGGSTHLTSPIRTWMASLLHVGESTQHRGSQLTPTPQALDPST
jgi:hypothetical protein